MSEPAFCNPPADDDIEAVEIDLLLEGIYRCYGFDFRQYSLASVKRRIWNAVTAEKLATISGLLEMALHDPACMDRLLLALTVNVTAMFRDPEFFATLRAKVIPHLRTYPFIRIWHAGCSTGEEVYSMAILLEEEGLYDRCRIYATDLNETALARAREGIFPLQPMQEYTQNYLRAGGQNSFSDYYTAAYNHARFRPSLRNNIVFAAHNLAIDGSFNEFHCIFCRNVMIYFQRPLQERVHRLLYESIARFGTLALGSKESLRLTPHENDYEALDRTQKIYRRIQ